MGLLTAGALHGAAHQAPQEFQVVTDRPLQMIEIGRVRIRFVKKAHLKATPTARVNTQTGQMRVSTPAATAFDLVRYPEHCGSLSNTTVLHDLAERLDGGEVVRATEIEGEVAYAGVSRPTLNRLESASQNITLRTLGQLCRALRCEPGDLFRPGRVSLSKSFRSYPSRETRR